MGNCGAGQKKGKHKMSKPETTRHHIGTLNADDSAKAIELAREAIEAGEDVRAAACLGIDGVYGYTCEFAGSPKQHIAEYDQLEAILEGRSW